MEKLWRCPIRGGNWFLSVPSARRANQEERAGLTYGAYFYPRPPRGGRRSAPSGRRSNSAFLSTPSARRATIEEQLLREVEGISIHALREEGDNTRPAEIMPWAYFYPRPPRGGRPPPLPLRCRTWKNFYPRPPRGGRPSDTGVQDHPEQFLSTPSARRATRTTMGKLLELLISIHALREEGDMQTQTAAGLGNEFLSTPSARRATPAEREENHPKTFLSTPSARRATCRCPAQQTS